MSSRTTTAVPGPLQASNKRHNAWPSHAGYDAGMKLPQSLNSVAAFAAIVRLTACAQAPAPASAITATLWLVDLAAARGPVARKTVTVLPGVGRVGGWVDAEVSPDEQRLAITRCVSAIESQGWLISRLSGPTDGSIDGPRASQRRKLQPAAGEAPRAAHFVSHWTASLSHDGYGGCMALAACPLLSDRVAAAASTVGISNFVSFQERTDSYRRDPHVPWTESEQIGRSLQRRGTPECDLLAESHGFARRENADSHFGTLVQFSNRTLQS